MSGLVISTKILWYCAATIFMTAVSASFFGFLVCAKKCIKAETALWKSLGRPKAPFEDEVQATEYGLKHPVRATLYIFWMLGALAGAVWSIVALAALLAYALGFGG